MVSPVTILLGITFTVSVVPYVVVNSFSSAYQRAGGFNHHKEPASLRKKADVSAPVVAYLQYGEFVPVHHAGTRWIRIHAVDQLLFVQKKVFSLGYSRLFGVWVVKTHRMKQHERQLKIVLPYLWIVLTIGLFILNHRRFRSRKRLKFSSQSIAVKHMPAGDAKLKTSTRKNGSIVQKKKKIEEEFYRQVEKNINKIYPCDKQIEDLQNSADYFKQQYEQARQEATIFEQQYEKAKKTAFELGVDLEDSNIDNLVKGRQFEIYAATIFHEDDKTTIKDWTPDKGIHERIKILSNGNPDFVILVDHNGNIKTVAVECKYRSRFYPNKATQKPTYVSFDDKNKIERYKEYQKENKLDVYLLLGVGGTAKQPQNVYLIDIDSVISIKHDFISNGVVQYKTTKSKLLSYSVSKENLIDKINSLNTN